jgi:hypothetical protein
MGICALASKSNQLWSGEQSNHLKLFPSLQCIVQEIYGMVGAVWLMFVCLITLQGCARPVSTGAGLATWPSSGQRWRDKELNMSPPSAALAARLRPQRCVIMVLSFFSLRRRFQMIATLHDMKFYDM